MLKRCAVLLPALIFVVGCTSNEWKAWVGPINNGKNVPVAQPDQLPRASLEAATRVDSLGSQILASNKDITIRPVFRTIGVTELTIFHQGSQQLFISEGLVNKCKTDGELTAVLCAELGKMVSESQAIGVRQDDAEPPFAPQVGSDVVGAGGNGDPSMTRQAERALWQQSQPRKQSGAFISAPNPAELSRNFLNKAGYNPDELIRVGPLLRQAEANPNYEKQLSGSKNAGP